MVAVAQLAEHRVVVPGVVGSNPISHPTKKGRSVRGPALLMFPRSRPRGRPRGATGQRRALPALYCSQVSSQSVQPLPFSTCVSVPTTSMGSPLSVSS